MTPHNQLTLAWRNLWRNRRRSLVTIASLAFGFAAVALFAGYTYAVYQGLANASIHGELIGHLTISHRGWETEGKLQPDRYLLSADEIQKIHAVADRIIPGAQLIPRLSASGLLSNGRSSTIFIANGIAPQDLTQLRGPFRYAPGALRDDLPTGVTAAQGLADVLGLKTGDSASVLVSTVHGQANAADVDVSDTVNTGNSATNDKLMIMPLALTQTLMDAEGRAEALTVLLPEPAGEAATNLYQHHAPDNAQTTALQDALTQAFTAAGLDLEVRTWQQKSVFFTQVKGMYDVIFSLMLTVVLAIVVLSIANAMSMAVIERTREIGTLRAIGVRRSGITQLFVSEALLLVFLGIASGMALTLLTRYGVNVADIRYIPPGNTISVPIYIGFDGTRTSFAALLLAVLAIVAAFLPARKAARDPIIESLGHV